MIATENAIRALTLMIHGGVTIKVRYEHPKRPTMASYRQGVPVRLNPSSRPGFPILVMPGPRGGEELIPLAAIESFEIEGGLRTERRAEAARRDQLQLRAGA